MIDDAPDRRLSESDMWFRDRLREGLSYGVAGLLLVSGWLISNDTVFSLSHPDDKDKREAAMLLIVASPVVWGAWYAHLVRLRAHCVEHPTVAPRRLVHATALASGLALGVLVFLVAGD